MNTLIGALPALGFMAALLSVMVGPALVYRVNTLRNEAAIRHVLEDDNLVPFTDE